MKKTVLFAVDTAVLLLASAAVRALGGSFSAAGFAVHTALLLAAVIPLRALLLLRRGGGYRLPLCLALCDTAGFVIYTAAEYAVAAFASAKGFTRDGTVHTAAVFAAATLASVCLRLGIAARVGSDGGIIGRRESCPDISRASAALRGKTVLVTGAGGSIGGELCRRVSELSPERLILLDICENGVFDIMQELIHRFGTGFPALPVICSVCDKSAVERVFAEYRPDVVFHAAAHKHVPFMELSPREAVINNVFGTRNVALAAGRQGNCRMVLISTDKAVCPASVMGATKRLCEMLLPYCPETVYTAVRFGNVFGSSGSVVPLFERQIAAGGPVTVTDRRATRYFMTLREAVGLLLEASASVGDGKILLLDTGSPVNIGALAERMVRRAGLTPYKDIDITEIGLRPGERLHEEMPRGEELPGAPCGGRITVLPCGRLAPDTAESVLADLAAACESGTEEDVRAALCRAVPEYKPCRNGAEKPND